MSTTWPRIEVSALMKPPPHPSSRPPRSRDLGRLLAQLLVVVFAVAGALPLGAGFFVRSETAQRWVSRETSRLLEELLDLQAAYSVEITLWPLAVTLSDVRVASSGGGEPAIRADTVTITPRIFSLMAGRLDIGDIDIQNAQHHLVVENGRVTNLDLKLPESDGKSELSSAPFRSLSATDARFDVTVDGARLSSGPVDIDVFAESDGSYEVALRVGESRVTYPPGWFLHGHQIDLEDDELGPRVLSSWDEDALCLLDARVRVDSSGVLLRRLTLEGAADIAIAPGTRVDCSPQSLSPERRIALAIHQARLAPPTPEVSWLLTGGLRAHLPLELINRFTDAAGPFSGWAELEGDLAYDGAQPTPAFSGKVRSGDFKIDGYRITQGCEGTVEVKNGQIYVPHIRAGYGDGQVDIYETTIDLLEPGVPLLSGRVEGRGVRFPYLIRDVRVTPNTIVEWNLDHVIVSGFGGTLDPPDLDGEMHVETSDFAIFDRAYHDPARKRMFGITKPAVLRGRFGLDTESLQFDDVTATFGQSRLHTTVHVGFDNWIRVDVPSAQLDLSELSPLVDIPLRGSAKLTAQMNGPLQDPPMAGTLQIDDFNFADFPLGELQTTAFRFRPLWVEFEQATLLKGESRFELPSARLDFDGPASVQAQARVRTQQASLLDFLALWRLEDSPNWRELRGRTSATANLKYTLGGPNDRCGGGSLQLQGSAQLAALTLFGEHYDTASADFDFDWQDIEASHHGFDLDLRNLHAAKGAGTILGGVRVQPGGLINGNLVGTGLPLSRIQAAGDIGKTLSGNVNGFVQLSGTLDELSAQVRAELGPLVVGRSQLPASQLSIRLIPGAREGLFSDAHTGCQRPIPAAAPSEAKNELLGTYHVDGRLFGNQIELQDLQLTRQDRPIAKGVVRFKNFRLGPLLELNRSVAIQKERPQGAISGEVELAGAPLDALAHSDITTHLEEFWLTWQGYRIELAPSEKYTLSNGRLGVPNTSLTLVTPLGHQTQFNMHGAIEQLSSPNPHLDLTLALQPVQLHSWAALLPQLERLEGVLQGQVQVRGPLTQLQQRGGFTLRNGVVDPGEGQLALSEVSVDVELGNGELRVANALARAGGGTLSARGRAPIRGFGLGQFRGTIEARNIDFPTIDGIDTKLDAELEATWQPPVDEPERLPKLSGTVVLRSFEYSRPVTMNADLATLARRGKRTEFEAYDPSEDYVELDLIVTSDQPLRLSNNLIEANLRVEKPGLQLSGTNQRFGARGRLQVLPGGRIQLRHNEFEVQAGEVRFEDPTSLSPRVDVTAVTEYRRYSSSSAAAGGPSGSAATAGGSASGQWRITMHAYGDAENLKLDLSSQPKMSQDDIFLLLTVGLTRAELDQAQSASLGGSVALEALGSITGADSAVTEAIPLIDEFRFGSAYSSITGRTEPTVTIGKRLTERLRAFVTSGLSEAREVRSNVEWRLNSRWTVEGSYDNVNDISSSSLGNLGADVRWRLEFR